VKRCSLALLAIAALIAAAPRPIAVVINGETLALRPPPRFERNVLFVPVRRTLEALGLTFSVPVSRSGRKSAPRP